MMPTWPIFIPSKARPHTIRVPDGLHVTLVVEPQDAEAYTRYWPQIPQQILPANDRGLTFVRQWIKDYATAQGMDWYWMLDDDIHGFFRVVRQRCVPCTPGDALYEAEGLAAPHSTVAQVALEYQQFAWSSTYATTWNSYADVCVAIHTGRTKLLRFRDPYDLKTDRDFTLQILASGMHVLRCSRLAFGSPKNGSNAGGLSPQYASGRELMATQWLVSQWPGICQQVVKSDGRVDAKVAWGIFARSAVSS